MDVKPEEIETALSTFEQLFRRIGVNVPGVACFGVLAGFCLSDAMAGHKIKWDAMIVAFFFLVALTWWVMSLTLKGERLARAGMRDDK